MSMLELSRAGRLAGRGGGGMRPSPARSTLLDLKNITINDSEIQQVYHYNILEDMLRF